MSEVFWKELEHAFADEDNARFDNGREAKRSRRRDKLVVAGLIAGVSLSVVATFFVFGMIIFNLMPLD